MNVWSLKKDITIKQLLVMLQHDFDANSFVVDTETQTDAKAIFIVHRDAPGMQAYLYTLAQPNERYGVQLEFPLENNPVQLVETYENLSYPALKALLTVHLDLFESSSL